MVEYCIHLWTNTVMADTLQHVFMEEGGPKGHVHKRRRAGVPELGTGVRAELGQKGGEEKRGERAGAREPEGRREGGKE